MRRLIALLLILAGLVTGCQLAPTVPERPARIAFMTDRDGNFAIYLMEPDGSNLTNLTPNPATNSGLPTWSHQANSIAFITDQGSGTLAV